MGEKIHLFLMALNQDMEQVRGVAESVIALLFFYGQYRHGRQLHDIKRTVDGRTDDLLARLDVSQEALRVSDAQLEVNHVASRIADAKRSTNLLDPPAVEPPTEKLI